MFSLLPMLRHRILLVVIVILVIVGSLGGSSQVIRIPVNRYSFELLLSAPYPYERFSKVRCSTGFRITHASAGPEQGETKPFGSGPVMGVVTKSVSEIMAASSAADLSAAREAPLRPYSAQKAQNPYAPMKHPLVEPIDVNEPAEQPSTDARRDIKTVQRSFAGPTYNESGWFPPDTMGAVGPSQFFVTLNGVVRVYNLDGSVGPLSTTLDSFFASVRGSSSVVDPRVRYDRLSQRWFVVAINITDPNNRIVLAWSDGPTITSTSSFTFTWFLQSVGGSNTNLFADYPTLGIDANAIYIGTNMYNGTPNTDLYVLPKANLLGGTGFVVHFVGLIDYGTAVGMWTPQPADNFYDPAATVGYIVGVDNFLFGKLIVRRVNNPGSASVTLSANLPVNVSTTATPISVAHISNNAGTIGHLDALDGRLMHAFIRDGRLFTTHTTRGNSAGQGSASGDRNIQRLYGIGNLSGTPSLDEERWIYSSATEPISVWMGSIGVNGRGERFFGYSTAGPNTYINAGVYRYSATIGAPNYGTNYTNNTSLTYNPAYDNGTSRGKRRWGDYSMTTVDVCDDSSFWTIQEAPAPGNVWGTYIAKVRGAPPGPITVSPSTVPRYKTGITVTVTGTGLWDPGPGFACRLAASIPGMVVNSVTYVNSTTAMLNVSTMASTPGAKTLTITNPDGQTATTTINAAAGEIDTIGIYRPSNSTFYLRNSNTTGPADITAIFGAGSLDRPVVGDWNGDGLDTIGIYRQTSAIFYLKDVNSTGATVSYIFSMGTQNDVPISGDWNIDGRDGVGVFRPSKGNIFLRNTLSTGFADYAMIFGSPGDLPIAGDWNAGGQDSPGVYRSAQARFYLTDIVCNCIPTAGYIFTFGQQYIDVPFAGDWDGNGSDGVGVFRAANGRTFFRNALSTGFANIVITYGTTNDRPVAGTWAFTHGTPQQTEPEDTAPIFRIDR